MFVVTLYPSVYLVAYVCVVQNGCDQELIVNGSIAMYTHAMLWGRSLMFSIEVQSFTEM